MVRRELGIGDGLVVSIAAESDSLGARRGHEASAARRTSSPQLPEGLDAMPQRTWRALMRPTNPSNRVPRRHRPSFALVIIALAGLVAACGGNAAPVSSDETGTASPSESSDAEAAFPVTIEHMYGSIVIPEQPERVVAAGFTDQDFALALGVTPVGVGEFIGPFPEEERPWAQEALGGAEPEKSRTRRGS